MRVRLEWKLQDLWVGAYWTKKEISEESATYYDNVIKLPVKTDEYVWKRYTHDLWVCVLPCLPIHFTWTKWELEELAS